MSGNDVCIHHVKNIDFGPTRTATLDDGRQYKSQKVVIEYLDLVDTSPTEIGWVTCETEITLFLSDGCEGDVAKVIG